MCEVAHFKSTIFEKESRMDWIQLENTKNKIFVQVDSAVVEIVRVPFRKA